MKKKIQKKHVNRVLNDIVDFIEFDCYIKTMDELFNNNICDYHEYLSNLLTRIQIYFAEEVKPYLSLENLEEDEPVDLELLDILDYVYDYKKLDISSFEALNNLFIEINEYILSKMILFVSKENVTKDVLINVINDIVKITEDNSYCKINKNELYQNVLSKEQYIIFKEHNFLNKITYLLKKPQIIGFDAIDFFDFLKGAKIIKIVQGDSELVFSNDFANKAIFMTNTYEVYNRYNKVVKNHNLNIEESIVSFDINLQADLLILLKESKEN